MADGRSRRADNGGSTATGQRGTEGERTVLSDEGLLRGLRIPRRFTRAGVHPYDDIEWERRTASLVARSGKVSFEQADVEFPKSWSLNATNIVAEKYFRGKLGTPNREWSVKQIVDRVVDTIAAWGQEQGRFAAEEDREAFTAELKHILVTQKASFNSPVWFNIGVPGRAAQASACFILHVDDAMDSIAEWYRDEMFIFKGGSGSGLNVSNLRSSYEQLAIGGYSSGPVSFMRGADAAAGTIKSGGATRRAAKMVVFNVDHPDLIELRDGSPGFVWCKAVEERKARALKAAGFDMDVDSGVDAYSIQYQNANNSVRITDEFMDAYLEDREWHLRSVTTGDVINTYQARDVMKQVAQAAWECADPGIQYHTTINDWHTAPAAGPITASNPCFTGDTLVHTDKGLIRFDELVQRSAHGETFGVYTHDATNPDEPAERVEVTSPEAYMVTGVNEVWRVELDNGTEIKCTPNHRFWTMNRGMVEARELTGDDEIKLLNVPTPAVMADWRLPVSTDLQEYLATGDWTSLELNLPEKWDEELAHYLGWLVGDGCISGDVITTVYAGAEKDEVLERHMKVVTSLNGGRSPKPCEMDNGTVQLRLSRRALAKFFRALGVTDGRAHDKEVPWSIFQAPTPIVAAFLRGLYDADGCAYAGKTTRYVGFASVSEELSRGVQSLLSTFGIQSRRYTMKKTGSEDFTYTRKDGSQASYESKDCYDLRIMGESVITFSGDIGFDLAEKSLKLCQMCVDHGFYRNRGYAKVKDRSFIGFETTYNLTEPRNHTITVSGVIVAQCSEYMHLDNSPCNLASLNLLKFLREDHSFDTEAFEHTVQMVLLAQATLCVAADYPTDRIGRNARGFRELGIGYANLGALLMAVGVPYDSEEGRAWAAAVTSLMQGAAYRASAEFARVVGPFPGTDELPGFAHPENREATLRVLRKHAAYSRTIAQPATHEERRLDKRLDLYRDEVVGAGAPVAADPELARVLDRANAVWDECLELADRHGVENSQVSVLAPTGCLVGGSLVATDRGLVRLRSLGDPGGERWQDLEAEVMTDHGPRQATRFFINGLSPVVSVSTERGYRIKGTPEHRIKVVDASGEWVWKRFCDLEQGDRVPLAMDQRVGEVRAVPLPPLPDAYWTSDHTARVPREMTPELAEFVGYFMGDGSLHAKGIRLCVASEDFDVVEHLARLGKSLFGLEAHVSEKTGYTEVAFHSVRLVLWWEACGFAKEAPTQGHTGKGYRPSVPDAVLHANDPEVYGAFLRGLFEADGTVTSGYPHWMTTSSAFAEDVQAMLLFLGYPTTKVLGATGWGGPSTGLRLLNRSYNERWLTDIGFIGGRKNARVDTSDLQQAARGDKIPMARAMVDRLAPMNDGLRRSLLLQISRDGAVSRRAASALHQRSGDPELGRLLGFFYDRVSSAELGGEELTYDLSVPDNVTYVANGFVSHNTIGFMMDCDTTGVEPDLALKKVKKLVGGGTMSIVNQTVPRALRRLGYEDEQIEAIVAFIDENNTVVGAPALKPEHYPVFACSFTGDNLIADMGHVKMMAAVQPLLSGAISKTVNVPEEAMAEDVEEIYMQGWRLGLKALAIYRDNCKADQPLSAEKKIESLVSVELPVQSTRKRLPKKRPAETFSFRVADCDGYVIVGLYPDTREPGEIFIKVAKQGSTLAGVMDAFSIGISIALQYGVPLETYVEKFMNMTFEPRGITDDPDIRFAASLMDFIFRKLALEYLPRDKREALGIRTVQEREQGLNGMNTAPAQFEKVDEQPEAEAPGAGSTAELVTKPAVDAPICSTCGVRMRPAGNCFACESCGSTSGCS